MAAAAVVALSLFLLPLPGLAVLAEVGPANNGRQPAADEAGPEPVEVYRCTTVYALLEAMNDQGSVSVGSMQAALPKAFAAAGAYYGIDIAEAKRLYRDGMMTLESRGEDDLMNLVPHVRAIMEGPENERKFEDCVRAVREAEGGDVPADHDSPTGFGGGRAIG